MNKFSGKNDKWKNYFQSIYYQLINKKTPTKNQPFFIFMQPKTNHIFWKTLLERCIFALCFSLAL